MPHPTVIALWQRYKALNPEVSGDPPVAEYFGDNEKDADLCARFVVTGRKRATSSASIEYEMTGELLPEPGKLVIITNWSGEAKAIIKTKRVTINRFCDVPAAFAALEGEGDGHLAWWRNAHRSFWTRAFTGTGVVVGDDFKVVCEEFDIELIA